MPAGSRDPIERLRVPGFVIAVGAISILANFGLELVADKWPQLGLKRFAAYTHKGS
jgi:hypothetical protein